MYTFKCEYDVTEELKAKFKTPQFWQYLKNKH